MNPAAERLGSSTALARNIADSPWVSYCLGALLYPYAGAHFYSLIFGFDALPTGRIIWIGLAAFFVEFLFIDRKLGIAYSIVFVALLGYLASALFYARGGIGDAALILANGGILFVLLRRRILVPIMQLMYLGLAAFFLFTAASGGTPVDAVAGNNGVSWVMLQAVVLLYVVMEKEKRNITLWPALIAFVLCIWASGRSGIVASGLLVLGVALLHYRQNRAALVVLAVVAAGLLTTGVLGDFVDLISSYLWYFDVLGFDPHDRELLLGHYWRELDATSLFFGVDLNRDSLWQLWGFNPHNSYLYMHSWLGFAAFILAGLMLGAVVRSFFCVNKLPGLLLIVLLLRAATDPLFFLSTIDFLVYYLVVRIYGEPAPAVGRMWSVVGQRTKA